ncbi:helix-turn-helix transcriptional regulator [Agrobacterium tumefaciens]|uniref:LuxR family transcriptional regulator n=1 Tax=Agrobacterium tumefaciens TaxID=358 RepID=A0AA44J9F4_AGRTU|nr:LuxR family transcriptional regulator [Agrobacterium tumefaciens]NSL21233.1 LuxR family transcriptional regulator [Agrobacterium tumefaciens]NTB83805.1 LuxR family transcriptional regulator [Agrobacterium tumefaciens]NTC20726.1 LuxR family transcriptional regulator [Agrobacterium tumefaciens]NTC29276.1 LuxR family transcriptional regulator [Agrobacterium tumefaciens]NTC57772.1 LuxR family transcriptional regulator [Agrobacterium tumefaciens]
MISSAGSAIAKRDKVIASLIDELDSPDFEGNYLRVAKKIVSFDMAMISIYEKDKIIVPSNLPFSISTDVLDKYQRTTYQFSPFFQHHLLGIKGGVYSMEKLASSAVLKKPTKDLETLVVDADEEVGYCTIGWPKRLKEIDIAVKLSNTQTAQIALYRVDASPFRPAEIELLMEVSSSLIAIYRRYWNSINSRALKPDDMVAVLLQDIAHGSLSKRELEVLSLVVEGRSGEEIASKLAVGEETVKTHKRRAYQKIGVNTHAELFSSVLSEMKKRL